MAIFHIFAFLHKFKDAIFCGCSEDANPTKNTEETNGLKVTSPSSSDSWFPGQSTAAVKWTSEINDPEVKVEIYKEDILVGLLSEATANDGEYNGFQVPSSIENGSDYRIKITSTTNSEVFDYSDYCSISGTLLVTLPTSSTTWTKGESITISWNTGNLPENVIIELYNFETRKKVISSSAANNGNFTWLVHSDLAASSGYRVKITSINDETKTSFSSFFFIKEETTLNITEPNSSTTWIGGTEDALITWETNSTSAEMRIELFKNGSFYLVLEYNAPNTGSYTFKEVFRFIPYLNDGAYQVRVQTVSGDISALSENFTIHENINIITPAFGTKWLTGTRSIEITWDPKNSPMSENVDIYLTLNEQNVYTIATGVSNSGSKLFNLPPDIKGVVGAYKVSIQHNSPAYFDESGGFTIEKSFGFNETFEQGSDNWIFSYNNVWSIFDNDQLQLKNTFSNQNAVYSIALYNTDYTGNFTYEFDVWNTSSDYIGIPLLLADFYQNYYEYQIYQDGTFKFVQYIDQIEYTIYTSIAAASSYNLQGLNNLKVEHIDNSFNLYINDVLVFSNENLSLTTGRVGASGLVDPNKYIRFDNIKLQLK